MDHVDAGMLQGRLIVESLRPGMELRVPELRVVMVARHDVGGSTRPDGAAETDGATGGAVAGQPSVWTFLDFEAPATRADELAEALAGVLEPELGWYADFTVADDHVIVFADRVFRYRIGDADARRRAVDHGLAAGTPAHQLDWGD